jgi:tetratricopeptide (TPR) repeat protein
MVAQSIGRLAQRAALPITLLTTAALALRRLDDSDTWWHLAAGRWIVENARVPVTDPFSHTVPDHAWINLQWLYDVALYSLWRVGGADALVLASAAAYTAAFAVFVGTLRTWVSTPVACALALWAIVVTEERFLIRPEMASLLLLSVILRVMMTVTHATSRRLIAIPLLMVLWVNSHSLFVIGLFCIACTAAGAAAGETVARMLGRRRDPPVAAAPLLICAAAAVVAAFANPYFTKGALFPLELLTRIDGSSSVYQTIGEFRSPWSGYFETLSISAYQILSMVAAASVATAMLVRAAGRRERGVRFRPGALASFAALLYASTLARRNTALFALGAIPTMAMALAILDDAAAPRIRALLRRFEPLLACTVVAAAATLTVWVATNGYYRWNGSTHAFGLGMFEANFPIRASDFAREAGLGPRLYNDLSAGGYLAWSRPISGGVFVDGRLEVYDTEFFSAYRRGLEHGPTWDEAAQRYGVNTAIIFHRWQNRYPLIRKLQFDRAWDLLHVDEVAVVFARRGSVGDVSALTTSYAETTAARLADRGAAFWQYPIERAVALRSYADVQILLGNVDAGLNAYDDLLDLRIPAREEAEVRYRYGFYLARRGELNRAREMMERAHELVPDDVRIERALKTLGG